MNFPIILFKMSDIFIELKYTTLSLNNLNKNIIHLYLKNHIFSFKPTWLLSKLLFSVTWTKCKLHEPYGSAHIDTRITWICRKWTSISSQHTHTYTISRNIYSFLYVCSVSIPRFGIAGWNLARNEMQRARTSSRAPAWLMFARGSHMWLMCEQSANTKTYIVCKRITNSISTEVCLFFLLYLTHPEIH